MEICIINTGGTISCSEENLNPVIKEAFPDTGLYYETELVFPESKTGPLDSTNLQPSDWCLMAKYILENYEKYDGFGTAVLSKPVIITGSPIPLYSKVSGSKDSDSLHLNFNTDAYQNVYGALACSRLGIPEIGVYFDAQLDSRENGALLSVSDYSRKQKTAVLYAQSAN